MAALRGWEALLAPYGSHTVADACIAATVPAVDLGLSEEQRAARRLLHPAARQVVVPRAGAGRRGGGARRAGRVRPGAVAHARDTGAVTMAVAEEHGGWGASLLDLALVAEQVGRAVAPAPVIEAQVAARLLAARVGDRRGARPALERRSLGRRASSSPSPCARPRRGGRPGAGRRGLRRVVVLDGDRLLLVPVLDADRRPVANLAAAPLADLDLGVAAAGVELASGPPAVARFEAAIDEWLVLTAAALVGHRRRGPRPGLRLRHRAAGVRRPDRHLPGRRPPARRRRHRPRRRPPPRPQGGLEPRPGAPRGAGSWRPWRSPSRPTPPRPPPTTPSTSTAATGSCSSTTCSCTTAGPGAGPGCGATPRPATGGPAEARYGATRAAGGR